MRFHLFQRQPTRAQLGLLLWGLVAIFVIVAHDAQGDVFLLKSGGQITGTEIKRGEQKEYIVQSDQGAIVTLSRRQIAKVVRQDNIELQYQQRSRLLPDTAESHRELATWCKQNRLSKQEEIHLQRIIELDPDDEAARLSLGYQLHHGRWMTREQIMAARGLRMYDGKHRTPQDIALREQAKNREKIEADWYRNIHLWVRWLNERRADEAAEKIAAIHDPLAASAIVRLLEKVENQRVRDLLTATLAELRHPLTVSTLVDFSLYEPDREVRLQCLDYLLEYHQPIHLKPYIDALDERKNKNNIINRAAEALQHIGDKKAISPLIDALVTTHKFKISDAPPGNTSASFTPSGGGGLSAGNKPKFYNRDVPNLKVRHALVELSGGQDFDYDEKLWRRWYVNQLIPKYIDTRRDQ